MWYILLLLLNNKKWRYSPKFYVNKIVIYSYNWINKLNICINNLSFSKLSTIYNKNTYINICKKQFKLSFFQKEALIGEGSLEKTKPRDNCRFRLLSRKRTIL